MIPAEQESEDSSSSLDSRLSKLVRDIPSPTVPALAEATGQRIRRNARGRVQFRATVTVLGILLVVWSATWFQSAPQTTSQVVPPLAESELASLFAPPPVDPLTELDRRQQIALQTLSQWGRSR